MSCSHLLNGALVLIDLLASCDLFMLSRMGLLMLLAAQKMLTSPKCYNTLCLCKKRLTLQNHVKLQLTWAAPKSAPPHSRCQPQPSWACWAAQQTHSR